MDRLASSVLVNDKPLAAPARGGAALSVFVFGLYMMGQGATLIIAPNFLLGLFKVPLTTEVWVRIVGWTLVVLGIYYVQSARHGFRPFFGWSAVIRVLQFGFFCVLVAAGIAPPVLLAFSAVELASGIWTLVALRREAAASR